MRVLSLKALREHWETPGRADSEGPLKAWYAEVLRADWSGPAEVKDFYRSASFVADNRVIFNIGGNKYRLVVRISYGAKIVMIKFVGTHEEYDDINSETVGGGKK